MYADQYALNNTGQTGGTPGADVDAELAWETRALAAQGKSRGDMAFEDLVRESETTHEQIRYLFDALIQIYFSSNTQRTNEILQFLAIVLVTISMSRSSGSSFLKGRF